MRPLIVLLLFAGVVLWDFVPVLKGKDRKKIWIYAALLAVSFSVLTLYALDVPLPSFIGMIEGAFGG